MKHPLLILALTSLSAGAQQVYLPPSNFAPNPYPTRHMICFSYDGVARYQAHGHSWNQFNLQQESLNRCLKHSPVPGNCQYGPCEPLY